MATSQELREALDDYVTRAKASERVRKTLKGWNCTMHIQATDTPDVAFTVTIQNGEIVSIQDGALGAADLIVSGGGEDLAKIFWGEENPASNYMQGAVQSRGSQDDVMRLDAMAMFVFLGQ
jgi:putative sterol carrier protein